MAKAVKDIRTEWCSLCILDNLRNSSKQKLAVVAKMSCMVFIADGSFSFTHRVRHYPIKSLAINITANSHADQVSAANALQSKFTTAANVVGVM